MKEIELSVVALTVLRIYGLVLRVTASRDIIKRYVHILQAYPAGVYFASSSRHATRITSLQWRF